MNTFNPFSLEGQFLAFHDASSSDELSDHDQVLSVKDATSASSISLLSGSLELLSGAAQSFFSPSVMDGGEFNSLSTHPLMSDRLVFDVLTGVEEESLLTDSQTTTQNLLPLLSTPTHAAPINPIAGDLYIVPGTGGESVTVRFQWTFRNANFNNEVGVFVLDAQGRVHGVAPGEAGFAYAAITSPKSQVLFAHRENAGAWQELTFQAGDRLGFYLIQNSSTAQWLSHNPDNLHNNGPVAFFSIDGANPDGFDHAHTQTLRPGVQKMLWEDLWGGGDRDFNDVEFLVSEVELDIPGEPGQFAPLTVQWLGRDAHFNNEMGFFLVDDAEGRIGNLMPGDVGYAAAALNNSRRQVVFCQGQSSASTNQFLLPSEKYLGWYLIQNATTDQFLCQNPLNQKGHGPLAFFSYPGANPDGLSHVHYRNGNEMVWEDQTGGGDRDYNDLIFRFELGTPPEIPPKPKQPEVTIDDVVGLEGKEARFTVSLSEATTKEVTITFATVDGIAKAREDYASLNGTLRFAVGETKKTISVMLLDDNQDEDDEGFFLRLDSATNAEIVDGEGAATIEDNDTLELGSIQGRKFSDLDGNGIQDFLSGNSEPVQLISNS